MATEENLDPFEAGPAAPEVSESSPVFGSRGSAMVNPQGAENSCGCGGNSGGGAKIAYPFVYALGRVEPRFPSLGLEKEFVQATGRADMTGLSDRQALSEIFSRPENRYLVRQMCWVFTIEGLETYLLRPRDPSDFTLLIEAVRPTTRATDVDVVIGVRGGIVSPETCNGLLVPGVVFDQLYSFDVDTLLGAIPKPTDIPADRFGPAAEDLFNRIMQMADNAGATDEHRALNYLAVRYNAIYATAAEAFGRNASLSGVEVRPSRLSGTRRLVDVIFSFRHRETDVIEKYFVRVDITEEFPFLVTKMSPYYDVLY